MKKNINNISFGLVLLLSLYSCEKTAVGYLSDNIFYQENPFIVEQGITTSSSPIVANGSTMPLHVKLLAIRDEEGNDASEAMLTEQKIAIYTGTITSADSTLDLLNAKIADSLVSPFNINSIGGRLEFSAATSFVNTGSYFIDVEVSNSKDAYEIKNATEIQLVPAETEYEITYRAATSTPIGDETVFNSLAAPQVTITRDGTKGNYIIFKFMDKNGHYFNPANNEIRTRSDRPSFADWDPWYAPVKTDTSMIFQYPEVKSMPVFTDLDLSGTAWSGGICYYRINGNYVVGEEHANPVFTIDYKMPGTYEVTIKLDIERKNL